MASGLERQSSSSLLICAVEIWRARDCSCSEGTFTSQGSRQRSWISASHCARSQLMSLTPLELTQGRHSSTTTDSDLAGMKPSSNMLRLPQL